MFTQLNQYRVILETKPEFKDHPEDLGALYVRSAAGGQVPLGAISRVQETNRSSCHQPPGAVPGHDHLLQPGAGCVAGGCRKGHRFGHEAARHAGKHPGKFPGHGPGLPVLAGQRASPDPGGPGDGLHRPRGPVRELHPPRHDPVHAAVGRGGRAPCPDPVPHRVQRHRADRDHPAHRHREEKRHHDRGFCPGCRAQGGQEPRRGHLSGIPAAVPPDHDDDPVGPSGRAAAGDQRRRGRRASPPPRHLHHRGAHLQPGAHALHDAGHLPLVRPAGKSKGRKPLSTKQRRRAGKHDRAQFLVPVHPKAGGDHPADTGNGARRPDRRPSAPAVGPAAG